MPLLRPVVLSGFVILAVGCSGGGPSAEQVDSVTPLVAAAATDAGLELAGPDARCVAENLGTASADAIVASDGGSWPDEVAERVSVAILDCVGPDALARSALEPVTSGASAESIDCAVNRIEPDLLATLIASDLGVGRTDKGVESVVVEAVSFCLQPVELLGRGG